MIYVDCNQATYWDVDRTLLSWETVRPDTEGAVMVYTGDHFLHLLPHSKHVEQLIAHKKRGHTIIVWSAGGSKWALAAVKALNIEDYVDVVLEKPMWVYDDKKCCDFMPKSDFIPHNQFRGQNE